MNTKLARRNRRAGHAYERLIAMEFQLMGFKDTLTSRYADRKRDDEKVDLVGTEPLNIQCKAWKAAPNYHKELDKMPRDLNYNCIFHKRPRQGDVVVMRKKDFYEILKMLKASDII